MFTLFLPRYVQEAKAVLKSANKLLCYNRDIWGSAACAEFEAKMKALEMASRERDRDGVGEATAQIDALAGGLLPPRHDSGWRENCEVFLVAIVIALGVRTYFLQPFTIPTGSMQPTLNGIIGHPTKSPPPNLLKQLAEFAVRGRSYVNVVAGKDERVLELTEKKFLFFFTVTDIRCEQETHRAWSTRAALVRDFRVDERGQRLYHAGEVIARGYVSTGDHVFVDKMTYNFRKPERGEVFVFKTTGIERIEAQLRAEGVEGSQFYIKRLAGLPGDQLRVDPPTLFVNGERAHGYGFERVMSGTKSQSHNGYHGYGNGPLYGNLPDPDTAFRVPTQCYFAMGDNSYNSSDSRYWGIVPEPNLMGRGFFVYWPFTSHWGLIK